MQLENGMLIISIDVDVGDKELGSINRGENDQNVHRYMSEYEVGKMEETALPLFLDLFNDLEIPVTLALRGQLAEVNTSIFDVLLNSPVNHDIGAHGYYHRKFKHLSHDEANTELHLISVGLKKFGITPRSFIFPKNSIAHLDLLEKYGYVCYRSYGDFMTDSMCIEKHGKLYNVHPSLFIDRYTKFAFCKKILDISLEKKTPFHIWFHLWNFGDTEKTVTHSLHKLLLPLLSYSKKKERIGTLTFETMLSASEKVRRFKK